MRKEAARLAGRQWACLIHKQDGSSVTPCSVWSPSARRNANAPQPFGRTLPSRKPSEGVRLQLDVDLSFTSRARSGMCLAPPSLARRTAWRLHFAGNCAQRRSTRGSVLPGASVGETGTAGDEVILRRGQVTRTVSVPRPGTSNWPLLEAVQRLPFDGAAPLEFDMFEDLDIHKPGKPLRSVGAASRELGGRRVRLHGFRHTGRGILPAHYRLDDRRRLITAAGSSRAII